jgi:hypothetical protein
MASGVDALARRAFGRLKWTPFFGPGVKVVRGACSFIKGAKKDERKTNETQSGLQGQSCLGDVSAGFKLVHFGGQVDHQKIALK